jgi:ribosomal protein L29
MSIAAQIADKEAQMQSIAERVKDATLPDKTYRELIKRNNELLAELQELKLQLEATKVPQEPISFEL